MDNSGIPLVSVLMTAYNRENYIGAAIESVLSSTYQNFELIIVDDRSKDKTIEIANQYAKKNSRVKVFINETNLGDYPNRNKAATYATGRYLKYLDSDDLIYPWGLEVMVNAMLSFSEAGFGLSSKPSDIKPFPILINPKEIYKEHFSGYGHFSRAPGSSIIRRDVFKQMNGFSGERMVGDLEFWLRIGRYYPMVKFQSDLYWNRLHSEQEVRSDYAKENYRQRTKKLIKDAFEHSDCPLNRYEIEAIQKKKLKSRWQAVILKVIRFMMPIR
jgi:glycosyltransferase involved in cell wall biosynthesis